MDITSQVIEAINAWLLGLVAQLLGPALAAVGQLIFATPTFDAVPEVEQAWVLVRNTTDALFVLSLLGAGVLVMASGSFESRYTAKLLVPRLALAAVAANASLAICGGLIRLNNALVAGLLGPDPGASVLGQLTAIAQGGQPGTQLVAILIGLIVTILAVLLVVLYIGRDLLLLLATVLAPLALATYALPQTDEIARLWSRVFGALLFVQLVQAVLVEIGVQLLAHTGWLGGPISDLTSGLVLVTLLYCLFKLPFAAYQWAFRQPMGRNPLIQTFIAARAAVAAA
jgi:hypothetical protein